MADYPRASATLEAKPTFVKPLPEPGVSIDGDWAQQLTEAGNYMLAHTWVRSLVTGKLIQVGRD